ncbi:MAG: hypothetical protein RIS59_1080 [Pseudomonadota bacterium]
MTPAMTRLPQVQAFLDAAAVALRKRVIEDASRASVVRILKAAETVGSKGPPPLHLPVCSWFDPATAKMPDEPDLSRLVETLRDLFPFMVWRRRTGASTASASFDDGHANAMLLGPGGIEDRRDVWIGLSLLAPHVRYPDHTHSPEETYLVLSPGMFRTGAGDWFEPGIGGSFYNPPNEVHCMRSGEVPLLALWALWVPHGEKN